MTAARPAEGLELRIHPGRLAVARHAPGGTLPRWIADGFSAPAALRVIARTDDETSVVMADDAVPEDEAAERGFRAMAVVGPLDFALTGILAALSGALAEAGIAIFAVSTHDTDWLLVREPDLDAAADALRSAGARVVAAE